MLADERKLFELVKRGGFTLNISGRQEIEEAIRKKRGGVWLELTPDQYAKLRRPGESKHDQLILPAPRPSDPCHRVERQTVSASGDCRASIR